MSHFTSANVMSSLPPEVSDKLHLLHLLRAKLVHFVNNLNNYLVTRVRLMGEREGEKVTLHCFSTDPLQCWT